MLPQSTYIQIDLARGEAMSLLDADGCLLRCVSGKLWLTEENGGQDIVLAAGQSFQLTRGGRAVIESIDMGGDTCCQLVPVRSASLLAALQRWVRTLSVTASAEVGQ